MLCLDRMGQHFRQAILGEMRFAAVGQIDDIAPVFDAKNPKAGICQRDRKRQAHITQPNNSNVILHALRPFWAPCRTGV